MVKVSVIVPVYNMEQYLENCLNSILSQTLKDIEIICIDDGSTDNCCEILAEYSKKHQNIILLRQENAGPGSARNKGIHRACGKYICFMDADDYYAAEDVLERLYVCAEKNGVKICGGNLKFLYEDGKKGEEKNGFVEKGILEVKEYNSCFFFQRFIYNLKMIRDNDIMFPSYRNFEDPPFFINAMSYAEKIYALCDRVYVYRVDCKKRNIEFDAAVDILSGIRDCMKIAREENYIKLYQDFLKSCLGNHLWIFCSYALRGCKEIWNLIDEIQHITLEWQGETCEILLSKEDLESYIAGLKSERNLLETQISLAENTVIYGAGIVGKYFLGKYGNKCRHIEGFAVSKAENEANLEGYVVKQIEQYSREALVVIAAGADSAKEMTEHLKKLEFKNICYVEYGKLQFMEMVESDTCRT